MAELVSAARGPVALQQLGGLEALRHELVAPAAHPLDRVGCGCRAGKVVDAGVPELRQVPHRRPRPAVLVDGHHVRPPPRPGRDGDQRDRQLERADELEHRRIHNDEHDGVDALPQQGLDGPADPGGIRVEGGDRLDAVARRAGGEVEVHGDRRRAEVRDAGGDEADGAGAAGDERAGRGRGAVAQLRDRLLDALAGGRPHVGQVVEHPRDGLMGHPSEARDIEDVRHPSRLVLGAHACALTL